MCVWLCDRHHDTWATGFFRLGQSHDSLPNYYTLNFQLKKHHGFGIDELENMLPFERDIYVVLLKQWIEEQNEKAKQKNG